MIMLRTLLAAALVLFALPAFAQQAASPVGSRLGLVPPKGMVPSQAFQGFEDREKEVAVIIGTLPPEAYADLEKSLTAEALKAEGISQEKREQITTPFGKAIMITGRQPI